MLLKHLRLEWVVVDSPAVPESVVDKNLILLGRLDAAHTGEIMRGMMTAEEIRTIRAAVGKPVVLKRTARGQRAERSPSVLGRLTAIAESYESGTSQANWTSPRYPQMPLIPNDTTLIIVTNDLVASAGEGLILRASQAENVVLVGENTMGGNGRARAC